MASSNCAEGYDPESPRCSKCCSEESKKTAQCDGTKFYSLWGTCIKCGSWSKAGIWIAFFFVIPVISFSILWDTTSLCGIGSLWYVYSLLTNLCYMMYYKIDWPKPIMEIAAVGAMLVFDPTMFQPECAMPSLANSFYGLKVVILFVPALLVLIYVLIYFIFKSVGNGLKKNGRKTSDADMQGPLKTITRLLYYDDNVRFDYFWRATAVLVDLLFCTGIYHSLSMFV